MNENKNLKMVSVVIMTGFSELKIEIQDSYFDKMFDI